MQLHMMGAAFALASAFFWGLAVVLFKKSGEVFSPITLNIYKSLVALVGVGGTMVVLGIPFVPDLPLNHWLMLSLSGFLGITLADIFFFTALNKLGAARVAVVECLYLPMVLVFSFLLLGERLTPLAVFGGILVLGAVLVGAFAERGADENDTDTVGGVIAGILSMVLLALGIVIAKQVLDDSDVFWATFVRVAAGVVTLAGIVALHPRRDQYIKELALSKAWLTALPASVCGNYVALLFWVAGMKYTTASRAGILNQMSTIFIFIMAAFILKERITKSKLAAITLALTGAVMTIFSN